MNDQMKAVDEVAERQRERLAKREEKGAEVAPIVGEAAPSAEPVPQETASTPTITAELTIRLWSDGNASVEGPLNNPELFMNLLREANGLLLKASLERMRNLTIAEIQARIPKGNFMHRMIQKFISRPQSRLPS